MIFPWLLSEDNAVLNDVMLSEAILIRDVTIRVFTWQQRDQMNLSATATTKTSGGVKAAAAAAATRNMGRSGKQNGLSQQRPASGSIGGSGGRPGEQSNESDDEDEDNLMGEGDEDVDSKLWTACSRGENDRVLDLIRAGADVNGEEGNPGAPLACASGCGRLGVVRILVKEGAKINHKDEDDLALNVAAWSGQDDVLEFLLSCGAKINATDNHGRTALATATMFEHEKCVAVLLGNGADPNKSDAYNMHPISFAVAHGFLESARLLISNGVDPNQDSNVGTPLGILCGNPKGENAGDLLELFLEEGADPNRVVRGEPCPQKVYSDCPELCHPFSYVIHQRCKGIEPHPVCILCSKWES